LGNTRFSPRFHVTDSFALEIRRIVDAAAAFVSCDLWIRGERPRAIYFSVCAVRRNHNFREWG
jgi:hypothetical protein